MEQTIPRLVQASAARYAEKSAVEDADLRLSFAELADAGLRAARAFCAAGIEPGDRVGIWAPNVAEWIIAAIGLQSAGGVLVTLNTRLKGAEAGYVLRKSGARILCTTGDFLGVNYVEALRGEDLPDLERIVVLREAAEGATSWSDFLAAGDAVSGPASIIEAVAQGNRVAEIVHRYLRDGRVTKVTLTPEVHLPPLSWEPERYGETVRIKPNYLEVNARMKNFREVESGHEEIQIREECKRCLRCDLEWQATIRKTRS